MNISKCPKCGNPTELSSESCPLCGIIFSRYYLSKICAREKSPENLTCHGRVRLIVDLLMGIFGLAMIFSGFVVIFISCLSNSTVSGGTSSLVLGVISLVSGITSVVFSAYDIARAIKYM